MIRAARLLATTVYIALGCVLAMDRVVRAQTPVEGWSGQVQCLVASRGAEYRDDQTHTWVLSGAPRVRNDFRDYPATWTVSGNGRRTAGSARAPGATLDDTWTYSGSDPSASITLWVPVGTGTIRITAGQRAVTAINGIRGTAASVPFAANVGEWRFQSVDVINGIARPNLSDSRTLTRSDLAGWRPPAGTTVTETCSWNLMRSGPGSAGSADAKGATAGAGTAGAGAARGAVTSAGAAAARVGGAAGAAAAAARGAAPDAVTSGGSGAGTGIPPASAAGTKPLGDGTARATGAVPASTAADKGMTAGSPSGALNPDVTRQYAAVGLTPAPGTGIVVATLVDDTGAPLVGVSVADLRLLDATSLPVGLGPYMFGTTGDIVDSSTLSVTASFNGRSRVAFLDAPVGKLTLTVIYSRAGKVVTRTAEVVTTAGGVTAVQP